ncbi:hypothetical protein [Serratia entomophila]|uniref:hypothetical protein n=1 Tax=Serratia entomophila TaxID=42906 RepID=UPI0021BA4659|nr:hypothetical protein [Serratia entomophila]
MIRNTKIIIAISFMVISLGLILTYYKTKRELVGSCHFYLQETNILTKETIRLSVNYFLYSDNTGFKTEIGSFISHDKRYTIDRDLIFTYSDMDHDGVYTVSVSKENRRRNDNSPRGLVSSSSKYKNKNYISFNKIGNDVYYIQERSLPYVICGKKAGLLN